MYYIPSIHNCISVELYYIYTPVTLWQNVSTVNGHLQANRDSLTILTDDNIRKTKVYNICVMYYIPSIHNYISVQ